jgi:cyclopropane fatty-acyl-phospholipid synthase-like methyltransferase
LDFGCGYSKLKELLPNKKIVGYDIDPEVTEIDDWKKVDFDVVVSNGVFYLLTKQELKEFLIDVYKKNPMAELIVNISRRSWINKLLLKLTRREDDWKDTRTMPNEELKILLEYMKIIEKTSIFFMTDIYYMRFNKNINLT